MRAVISVTFNIIAHDEVPNLSTLNCYYTVKLLLRGRDALTIFVVLLTGVGDERVRAEVKS